jgi:5-formyltetrahydrofolate cyclo-ligase
MSSQSQNNRNTIRQNKRQARRALTSAEQKNAALQLSKNIQNTLSFKKANKIAVYLPSDGEISPEPLFELAKKLGKTLYLPVLPKRGRRMRFAKYQQGDHLIANKYQILEPKRRDYCPAWALDLVLLPLVAFDDLGNRMGMGGGFYDATFENKLKYHFGPKLIGLAHDIQKVERLEVASWDVPLSAIITDRGIY